MHIWVIFGVPLTTRTGESPNFHEVGKQGGVNVRVHFHKHTDSLPLRTHTVCINMIGAGGEITHIDWSTYNVTGIGSKKCDFVWTLDGDAIGTHLREMTLRSIIIEQ